MSSRRRLSRHDTSGFARRRVASARRARLHQIDPLSTAPDFRTLRTRAACGPPGAQASRGLAAIRGTRRASKRLDQHARAAGEQNKLDITGFRSAHEKRSSARSGKESGPDVIDRDTRGKRDQKLYS